MSWLELENVISYEFEIMHHNWKFQQNIGSF